MGSIAKRPDGTYRARYRDESGREHSKHFVRRADAQRWAAEMTASVARGDWIDPADAKVTLAYFAGQWLREQTFDAATRQAVEGRWRRHIEPTLGDRQLRSIRPSTVRAWLAGLEPLAPNYRRVIFANLSSIFSAAVDDGLLRTNPCSARTVRTPKLEQNRVQPWPTERLYAVIAALPDRYQAIAVVAAACGLRQGEVFGLRVSDVDFLRRVIRVEQQVKVVGGERPSFAPPKGGRRRAVPLSDVAAQALAAHVARFPAGEDGLIFTSREGKPLNRNYVNARIWKPALRRAGVDPSRENGMHALRHYYASVLIDAGESAKAVAEFLGHADPGFTLRVYAHLFPAGEDRARRAVDAALGPFADFLRTEAQ